MKSLNRDYRTSAGDMLDVVEGHAQHVGAFDQNTLFVRSLERLPWHYVVALCDVENMKRLYTQEVRDRIRSAGRRETFDVALVLAKLKEKRWVNSMGLTEIILIAVGLAMDAFAVSITLGLSVKKPKSAEVIIPGLYFGVFQALMPTVGYFLGIYFANKIQFLDHWIAFVLLGFIGGKMIKDSFSKKDPQESSFGFVKMLILAFATSIDALAVGITYAFFEINIFMAVLITGLITFFISTGGVIIGNLFGGKLKSKAEFLGGAVLVILGTKILIEHLLQIPQ